MPDFESLKIFLSKMQRQSDIKITYEFEMKVIFPIYDIEIFQNNNIEALRLILLQLPESLYCEIKFMEYKNGCVSNPLDKIISLKVLNAHKT